MENCIFCKISSKKIPADIVYEDNKMIIFRDIDPKAAIHFLAIPKKHFSFLSEMDAQDADNLGYIFKTISKVAPDLGLKNGYRLIINQGKDAGQTVFHLHIHILGGQELPFEKL